MIVLASFGFALLLLDTSILIFLFVQSLRARGVRPITRPTQELADFMDDIKGHGYSVVRVSPDSIMVRSPR